MNSDEFDAVYVRELGIDDIAPVYHLGEKLFTSELYPYLCRVRFNMSIKKQKELVTGDRVLPFVHANLTE
jgi:hypothetical protein